MSDSADFHPLPGIIPYHVGIIPDGGRRWAVANQCSLTEAYLHTRKLMYRYVERLLAYRVREISIYIASVQNFRRDGDEVGAMLGEVAGSLEDDIRRLARQHELKVVVVGRMPVLPGSLAKTINDTVTATAVNTSGRLNLLLAYDPIDEVMGALRSCRQREQFHECLAVSTPLDLVIRTGGAQLLSNFLPLQSGYARLYFSEKLFNDFTLRDLDEVLHHFSSLERKFGT